MAAYPHSIKRELLKDVSPKAENMCCPIWSLFKFNLLLPFLHNLFRPYLYNYIKLKILHIFNSHASKKTYGYVQCTHMLVLHFKNNLKIIIFFIFYFKLIFFCIFICINIKNNF